MQTTKHVIGHICQEIDMNNRLLDKIEITNSPNIPKRLPIVYQIKEMNVGGKEAAPIGDKTNDFRRYIVTITTKLASLTARGGQQDCRTAPELTC